MVQNTKNQVFPQLLGGCIFVLKIKAIYYCLLEQTARGNAQAVCTALQ